MKWQYYGLPMSCLVVTSPLLSLRFAVDQQIHERDS